MNELTDEDVTKILKKKLDKFGAFKYELVPFEANMGLLGDHAVLRVAPEDQDEITFFVKFFPSNSSMAKFARETGAFSKELFTHELLFRRIKSFGILNLEVCTANCYLQEKDRALVFDDLIAEGFQAAHKHTEYNYAEILTVLRSLSQLHAASLIYEEKRSKILERDYRINEEYPEEFVETFYRNEEGFINIKGVKASVKAILTEVDMFLDKPQSDFKIDFEKFCYKIYDYVKPSSKYRNVISHGDLWCTNILVKYEKGKPTHSKFVDFQMTRYCPPAHDVMSVLHLTTSRIFRQKHMYELMGLYYNSLEANLKLGGCELKSLIGFEEFLQSCEEQKLFALVQTATYFQLILLSDEILKQLFSDPSSFEEAIFEDRSALFRCADNDEFYKRKLEESLRDLVEYYEIVKFQFNY